MEILFYALTALGGYLLGCSNMALYLSRRRGIDLRAGGSGNLGASNAMITMGWKAAVIVGIHDIGKAVLAVLLARYLLPQLPAAGALAGACCVLGHIFPFYLRFRGGKGFAAYIGMTIALNWRFAIIVLCAVVVVTLITDYIVAGTVTTIISFPAFLGITTRSWLPTVIVCAASLVILARHRGNFIRIWNGTEMGLRRSNRGEGRMHP